jgi:hypothetical protein
MASTRDERDARATNATPTIRALDGRAFVHDAADVVELRERRRVIGAMVGALPGFRSQDVARGLPLELTAEETALCVERGWARLTEERDGDDAGATGRERATEGDDATRDDALKRAKARAKAKRDGRGWGGGGREAGEERAGDERLGMGKSRRGGVVVRVGAADERWGRRGGGRAVELSVDARRARAIRGV